MNVSLVVSPFPMVLSSHTASFQCPPITQLQVDLLVFVALRPLRTDFRKLVSKQPPNNIERAEFGFVFVLLLSPPRQSDPNVLGQMKGGPSGQKAIKMTCCERMQSGM